MNSCVYPLRTSMNAALSFAALIAINLCPASQPSAPGHVILIKLTAPEYPPKARTAGIYGDVSVAVKVRVDGRTEAQVEDGHPMLREAALDSARMSLFECRGCDSPITYHLAYSFQLARRGDCCNTNPAPLRVAVSNDEQQDGTRIVITTDQFCFCDPGLQSKKNRSAKCLYLWRCS